MLDFSKYVTCCEQVHAMLLRGMRRTIAGLAPINATITGWRLAEALIVKAVVRAKHSERLARSCLPIRKNSATAAPERSCHEGLDSSTVNFIICRFGAEGVVETKAMSGQGGKLTS